MAKFNVVFEFATVYDVNKFDVVKGQPFKLNLTDVEEGAETDWFSNNDPVLRLVVTGLDAEVEATNIGKSTILVFAAGGGQVIKQLEVNVVEAVKEIATALNAVAGIPEPK